MIKKRGYIIIFLGVLLLIIPLAFAGPFDWLKKITGYAESEEVNISITVTGNNTPTIQVYNETMDDGNISDGPNEGDTYTNMVINFTAYDADGYGNINDSSAKINLTLTGETPRNVSCTNVSDYALYYVNYTCSITMAWWDGAGTWTINATISDNTNNNATNDSTTFYVGATDAYVQSLTTLTWGSITAGATLEEANDDIELNNTGNMDKYIEVNATNLRGESTPGLALWAGNFTVKDSAGCGGTAMSPNVSTNITSATLPAGNFSIDDKSTGQEVIHFCLETAGSELIAQDYSTLNEGPWKIKIVDQ